MRSTAYRSLHRQRGISFTGVLVLLSCAVFIGLFAMKVGPHYLEHLTVTSITNDLVEKPELLKQSRSKVYEYINQGFRTNNLWDLKAEDTVTLKRDANKGYLVTVQYERRANLFRNIDVITSFHESPNGEIAE